MPATDTHHRYDHRVFASAMAELDIFVRHLVWHRAIVARHGRLAAPGPAFWSMTSGSLLVRALLSWCKVFGSWDSNQTHWTRLDRRESERLRQEFKAMLNQTLGLGEQQWIEYRQQVIDFRDSYIAHTDLDFSAPVPVLDRALDVAYAFDTWVRELIAPDVLDEQPLRREVEALIVRVENSLEAPSLAALG